MKPGSLVRKEVCYGTGRTSSYKDMIGIVLSVDEFQTPEEISEMMKDWLADMGPRVEVYWSDSVVSVQPGNSLEVLA